MSYAKKANIKNLSFSSSSLAILSACFSITVAIPAMANAAEKLPSVELHLDVLERVAAENKDPFPPLNQDPFPPLSKMPFSTQPSKPLDKPVAKKKTKKIQEQVVPKEAAPAEKPKTKLKAKPEAPKPAVEPKVEPKTETTVIAPVPAAKEPELPMPKAAPKIEFKDEPPAVELPSANKPPEVAAPNIESKQEPIIPTPPAAKEPELPVPPVPKSELDKPAPSVAITPMAPAPSPQEEFMKALNEPVVPAIKPAEETKPVTLEPKKEDTAKPAAPSGNLLLSIKFISTETTLPLSVEEELKKLAETLKKQDKRVTLFSYASESADQTTTARRVSLSRVLAVRAFLLEQGVDKLNINVRAEGSRVPDGEPNRVDIVATEEKVP